VIGLVTDSSSQIPAELASALGVEVVPVTVVVDGVAFQEGVDIDADSMWARFAAGATPEVRTSQPSPGAFIDTYRRLLDRGATEIVSVHVSESYSGTINSARVAAEAVAARVHVVDSGTASFGIAFGVWEAATAIASGTPANEVAERVASLAPTIRTSFILQALDFARAGGRFGFELPDSAEEVVVLAGSGADIDVVATGRTVDQLCDLMVDELLAAPGDLRVGVCLADPATLPFTEGIESRLTASGRAIELVRYRVGPSIAAHTGPGTAGGFSYPTS
jgi:DegV family protein with EDD domain